MKLKIQSDNYVYEVTFPGGEDEQVETHKLSEIITIINETLDALELINPVVIPFMPVEPLSYVPGVLPEEIIIGRDTVKIERLKTAGGKIWDYDVDYCIDGEPIDSKSPPVVMKYLLDTVAAGVKNKPRLSLIRINYDNITHHYSAECWLRYKPKFFIVPIILNGAFVSQGYRGDKGIKSFIMAGVDEKIKAINLENAIAEDKELIFGTSTDPREPIGLMNTLKKLDELGGHDDDNDNN